MHHRLTRSRVAIGALLATSLVLTGQFVVPAAAGPRGESKIAIEDFMTGLACVESGGRYEAVNPTSGAYGKYQIMPRNWPVWARRFLGDRRAEPTPQNQELVARERIERLYDDRGSWRLVAYWWLTGGSDPDEANWSRKAAGYVDRVMGFARQAASLDGGRVPRRCYPAEFTPVAPDAAPPAADQVVVTGGSVYVRRAPGAENRLFAIVRRGNVLRVTGRADDARGRPWLEVKLGDGVRGWIASWYTEPGTDS